MRLQEHRKAIVGGDSPEETLLILINDAVGCAEASGWTRLACIQQSMVNRSRRIVTELATVLNTDNGGEQAFNLLRLYIFINRRLADSLEGDERGLPDALRVLRHVQQTWIRAIELANNSRCPALGEEGGSR